MSKPVNTKEFWKTRIEQAPQIRYSVYITSDQDWNHINETHNKILEPYKNKKVLDAGCGYGRWSEKFVNYTGIDFSEDFIEKAEELYPDEKFYVRDLKDTKFKNKEFDLAFCVSVKAMIIGNLGQEEWDLMEKELKRVAKTVILLEYSNPQEYEIIT